MNRIVKLQEVMNRYSRGEATAREVLEAAEWGTAEDIERTLAEFSPEDVEIWVGRKKVKGRRTTVRCPTRP